MSCEEQFFKELRKAGFRLTPQREIVLSVMHEIEGFATVEEIYDRVKTRSASLDVSTVYRSLELFQDFHLVASIDSGDGQRRYELVGLHGAHIHLVCRSCGAVIGVDLKHIAPLMDFVEKQYGFEVDLEHLSIPGTCRECVSSSVESGQSAPREHVHAHS
jgi:Fur family ferric uptake transcriptional regulator